VAVKLLLDTNAYTAMRHGHTAVAAQVRQSSGVVMSVVVLGELLYGFHHGSQLERNLRELREFVSSPYVEVQNASWVTADRFGRVAAQLRRSGRPIPTNDIWIAAHALETGGELLTFDRHFERVEGIVVRTLRP